MIGIIAKLTIKPGTNADFEATMKALQAKVHADEPGNKLYALHDLHLVARVLDQREVQRLVGHGRPAGQRARRRPRLGMAVENPVHGPPRRRCRRQISCMTWTSGRPAR